MNPTLFPVGIRLVVTILLAVVPFISATPPPLQPSGRELQFRDLDVQQRDGQLPQKWAFYSCYTDSPSQRTLTSISSTFPTMSNGLCVNFCAGHYLALAGTENGTDCYCGNITTGNATKAPASDCNIPCGGDAGETCGGSSSLSLYWNGLALQPNPTFVQHAGSWNLKGCFNDSNDARGLAVSMDMSSYGGGLNLTVDACVDACSSAGYAMAGVELATQCRCDNNINNGARLINDNECNWACAGNSFEYCGGSDAFVLYSGS